MEEGIYRNSKLGTPQGGIVSPVLANIYLNELDQWAKNWTDFNNSERISRRNEGKGNWDFVRYADDFLFLTNGGRGKADEMRERIGDFVKEELNLKLSEKKTEIVHANDGFEFLGYHLQLTEEGGVFKSVPKEAKEDLLGKVKRETTGGTEISSRRKIKSLNALLRGWANYYKYANDAGEVLNKLDHRTWENLTDWLARKHKYSKRKLYSNILEGKNPLRVNGVTLYKMCGDSDLYTDEYTNKDHPYLDGRVEYRKDFPDTNYYLGEDREGWSDARWKTLERDNWNCQMCGRNLRGLSPHVHHDRPYSRQDSKEEANRMDNLVSLCPDCHNNIEKDRKAH